MFDVPFPFPRSNSMIDFNRYVVHCLSILARTRHGRCFALRTEELGRVGIEQRRVFAISDHPIAPRAVTYQIVNDTPVPTPPPDDPESLELNEIHESDFFHWSWAIPVRQRLA